MNHSRTLQRLIKLASNSGAQIRYKQESAWMRALSKVLFFRKDFMGESTSVWGEAVYFPDRHWFKANPEGAWKALAHGMIHLNEIHRLSFPVYFLAYLFPQSLALLALAFPWVPECSVFMVALFPWPAPYRKSVEMRAYSMTMAAEIWSGNGISEPPDWVIRRFTGPYLYWAWPFPNQVRSELHKRLSLIKAKRTNLPHASDVKFSIRMDGYLR